MKDARYYLIKALIVAIAAKLPTFTIYTKIPKESATYLTYPFIYITDILDIENGSKGSFIYEYNLVIELVYSGIDDKTELWSNLSLLKEIVTNCPSISLEGNFKLQSLQLVGTDESDELMNSQIVDTARLELMFMIEDNN